MEQDSVSEFLRKMTNRPSDSLESNQWDKVIQPNSSYLIVGDIGTGKSALAYYLLETFGEKYSLTPAVVGIPPEKAKLLPSHFRLLHHPAELTVCLFLSSSRSPDGKGKKGGQAGGGNLGKPANRLRRFCASVKALLMSAMSRATGSGGR